MTFCLYLLLWIKTEMYFWETGELHHSFVSPLRVCVFWKLLCSKVFKTEVSDPLLLSGCSPTESRSSVLVNTVVQYFFFRGIKWHPETEGKKEEEERTGWRIRSWGVGSCSYLPPPSFLPLYLPPPALLWYYPSWLLGGEEKGMQQPQLSGCRASSLL